MTSKNGVTAQEIHMLPDGRVDAKNAAAYVGLSVKTLAGKRCRGTGPQFLKRGRVFYYVTDLDAWLQAARVQSTAKAATLRRTIKLSGQ